MNVKKIEKFVFIRVFKVRNIFLLEKNWQQACRPNQTSQLFSAFICEAKSNFFLVKSNVTLCKTLYYKRFFFFKNNLGETMWYEGLSSLLLTGTFVMLPYVIIPFAHKWTQNGNVIYFKNVLIMNLCLWLILIQPYSRKQNTNHDRWFVRRDIRLTGDTYVLKVW